MTLKYQNISSIVLIFGCIDRILQTYIEDSAIVFSVNTEYFSGMPQMQHRTKYTWMYFSVIKPGVYIIDCSSYDLESTLQSLEYNTFFNPSAVFILITDFVDSEIAEILRKYFIFTFIILENSTKHSLKLYGAAAMLNMSEPSEIGSCTKQRLLFNAKMLERKASLNWDNYTLRIGVGESPPSAIQDYLGGPFEGFDVDIVDFISARMQIKPQYERSENYVGFKRNGTYNGALGTLVNKSVDMVMGGMFGTGDSCLDFTISYPIHRTSYRWFVPGPKSTPFWQRILLIYQPSVSLAVISFYVFMVLLNMAFNSCISDEERKYHGEFFKLCSSAASAPVRISQREKCSKKMVYLCWFLFWLILNACSSSKLLQCLIKKTYDYPINSLEGVTQSKFDICILRGLEFGLSEYGSRVFTCTECEECSNRTAFQRDLITVRNSDLVNFYESRYYLSSNGDPLLHPLKEKYFATFNVMIFRKNHPVFDRFNVILRRMITSGIVAHMRRKYGTSWEKNNIPKVNEWGSLKLEPLKFLFQFVVYGLILSIVVFAIEILMIRYVAEDCSEYNSRR